MSAVAQITGSTLLPELFRAHPSARAVLNRYGLRGCGGVTGPSESLAFFAAAHGVDEERLLREVRETIESPEAAREAEARLALDSRARVSDAIYRPFFLAGMAVVLSLGAAWGVLLLWKVGVSESFVGVTVFEVNAHGHAQVMGWVGLFIMGFAYQAFPRMWQTRLPLPGLAVAVFIAMVASILVRSAAMYFHGASWSSGVHGLAAGVQIAAVYIFVVQIAMAFVRSGLGLTPSAGFIFAALLFMLAQAIASGWHTAELLAAEGRGALLAQIATYQAPLRDLQIHGMAMLMIFGVGLRLFPALYGLAEVESRRAWLALGILVSAVLLEVVTFVAFRVTGSHMVGAALLLPWIMLPVGAALIVLAWKPWGAMPEAGRSDRSGKFVRAAFVWLFVSFGLLLLMPVYQFASGTAFSHAYHGAVRHAITVGFVSLMIMGMGAKVVPTLHGIDTRRLSALWGPFLLVNAGCLLRVTLQISTDWRPVVFPVVGVSGVLELAGLGWWAAHLAGIMWRGRRGGGGQEADVEAAPAWIAAHHRVGDVVRWYPETIEVLAGMGFAPIRNPVLRRTVAGQVTLAQAAMVSRVPLVDLVGALNTAIGAPEESGGPSCSGGCAGCACAAESSGAAGVGGARAASSAGGMV